MRDALDRVEVPIKAEFVATDPETASIPDQLLIGVL
jgi:hypothetical protein